MAGGIGSRFGGLKQLTPIDENGNYIIDYSIFDAIRSGFDKIVFIISKENFEIFNNTIGERVSKKVKVSYVFQSNDGLGLSRTKPLGTGYAVLLTKNEVSDKFAVINADDFYGYESFNALAKSLNNLKDDEFCTTVFKIKNTLSNFGNVTRGLATVENNTLIKITESEITSNNGEIFARDLLKTENVKIDENSLVSMNMFGFNKKLFEFLQNDFDEFIKDKDRAESKEFYLPTSVTNAINNNLIKVITNKTDEKWLGLTYKQDLENVKLQIRLMKKQGIYPENLWK